MRLSTSKSWMFLAASALVCALVPLSITAANGAPSAPGSSLQSPAPPPAGKVKTGDEATPAPITYNTINGIWEVQLQPGGTTVYSHFELLNTSDAITGTWKRDGVDTQLNGTQTGDRFTFNGSDAAGAFVLNGYIENSATIIGQMVQGNKTVAFTATHQGLPLNERPQKHHRRHHKNEPAPASQIAVPTPSPAP